MEMMNPHRGISEIPNKEKREKNQSDTSSDPLEPPSNIWNSLCLKTYFCSFSSAFHHLAF